MTLDATCWATALDTLRQYTFKVLTPNGSGTGFMLTREDSGQLCGIATAYHVIDHAYQWDEPIKLVYTKTGGQKILRSTERFIFPDMTRDTAVVVFRNETFDLPKQELDLVPEDKHVKQGISIGWAGYPVLAPNDFSFFSGTISCFLSEQLSYLVDGVAINGVSGGPAFHVTESDIIHLVGVVSAYISNRCSGESLPGVCFVTGIHSFYRVIKAIKSLEEAARKAGEIESKPQELPESRGPEASPPTA